MDAVEFLKIKSRICESHDCFDCPIGTDIHCSEMVRRTPSKDKAE